MRAGGACVCDEGVDVVRGARADNGCSCLSGEGESLAFDGLIAYGGCESFQNNTNND